MTDDGGLAALTAQVAALTARLERLETEAAALDVARRYARAADSADLDLLAECFTDDAVLTTSKGPRTGRGVIVDYYRTALAEPLARKHFITNAQVTPTGPGTATMQSYFLYTFAGPETSILGWGTYDDTVRVVDGVGYLSAKRITVEVQADPRTGWFMAGDR